LRRDHRPYFVKRLDRRIQKLYTRRILGPQFDRLGRGAFFMKPWHVEVFGPSIEIGDYATVIAAPDLKVRLTVWSDTPEKGFIRIGRFCLICPGVRMGSAAGITIGENCMFASGAYITDADWHGLYDRTRGGESRPIVIADNVWVGDRAMICKGVRIGANSIVGAGAVVTHDIPGNSVVAGNPARIVKSLDPDQTFITRKDWYSDPEKLSRDLDLIDQDMLRGNTIARWFRHLILPGDRD